MKTDKIRVVISLTAEELAALDLMSLIARKRRHAFISDLLKEYLQPVVESMREAQGRTQEC